LRAARQPARSRPPDRSQRPGQRRAFHDDRDEAAEHEVVAHREPAQRPGRDVPRDRRADRGAGAELGSRFGVQRRSVRGKPLRQRITGAAAGLAHHQRRRRQFLEAERPTPARPRVRRCDDHDELIVAQRHGRQVGRQSRRLDESELMRPGAHQLDHPAAVPHGEIDRRRLDGVRLLRRAQRDKPTGQQALGDGLTRGDRQPGRATRSEGADAGIEACRRGQHLL